MKFYKVVGADRRAASGESSVTVKAKDEKDAIKAAKKKGLGKIKSVDVMKDYMKFLSTLKKETSKTAPILSTLTEPLCKPFKFK